VGTSSKWYRNEIRSSSQGVGIYSFRDAQGFRKPPNQKLRVARVKAYMHHYGWVKEPAAMQRKQENFHKMWHDDQWISEHVLRVLMHTITGKDVSQLARFEGTHPSAMSHELNSKTGPFDTDISIDRRTQKTGSNHFAITGLESSSVTRTILRRDNSNFKERRTWQ